MLRKGLVVALVVGLVAAGIAVASGGGRPSRSEPFTTLPGHAVTKPAKTVTAAATRNPPLRKVIYRESTPFTVNPDSERTVALKCPRRTAAINGYFGNDAKGVVLDYSAVAAKSVRKWVFGVLNVTGSLTDGTGPSDVQVFIGVVCVK
jgi:hypothetical protein